MTNFTTAAASLLFVAAQFSCVSVSNPGAPNDVDSGQPSDVGPLDAGPLPRMVRLKPPPPTMVEMEWRQESGSPQRLRWNRSALLQTYAPSWDALPEFGPPEIPNYFNGMPAVGGTSVAFGSSQGAGVLELATGAVRWLDSKWESSSVALPDEGVLVVGRPGAALLDLNDGHAIWTRADLSQLPSLAVDRGIAYFGLGPVVQGGVEGAIEAIELKTGTTLWRYPTNGLGGLPSVVDDRMYSLTGSGVLLALERTTGRLVWQAIVRQPTAAGTGLTAHVSEWNGFLVVAGGDPGLVVLDAANGTEWWRRQVGVDVAPVAYGLVFATVETSIAAYDIRDGTVVWTSTETGLPILAIDGKLLTYATTAPDTEAKNVWIDTESGKRVGDPIPGRQAMFDAAINCGSIIGYGRGGELGGYAISLLGDPRVEACQPSDVY